MGPRKIGCFAKAFMKDSLKKKGPICHKIACCTLRRVRLKDLHLLYLQKDLPFSTEWAVQTIFEAPVTVSKTDYLYCSNRVAPGSFANSTLCQMSP